MKDKIKVVFVGHVDHGKSTLIGRLLYDTKSIPEDKFHEIRNNNGIQGDYDFAFLMDNFEEERKQGVTIDTAQIFFKTTNKYYVIIDAPGHIEFIVNMITGAAQADVAVLIVDACEGVQEQTKRHAVVLSLLGIKQVVLAINKMDLVGFDKSAYEKTVLNIIPFLSNMGFDNIIAVPISALNGDNVTLKSSNMSWYQGMTLCELFDSIEINNSQISNDSLFTVQDVYNIFIRDKRRRIIVGKVESGVIEKDQSIMVLPSNESAKIEAIEIYSQNRLMAHKGESVGIVIDKPLFVERGNIIASQENKLRIASSFKATILWVGNSTGRIGDRLWLRCSTQEVYCYIDNVYEKINSSTLEIIEGCKDNIKKLELCEVSISTKQPLVINEICLNDVLSRFILMDKNNIVAIGVISYISEEENK